MPHFRQICTVVVLLACQAATLAFDLKSSITRHDAISTGPQSSNSRILSNSSIGSQLNTRPFTERLLHCDGDEYGRGLDEWSCMAAANDFWTMRQDVSFGPRGTIAYMKTPWRISSRESQHKLTCICGVLPAYMRYPCNSGREMCIRDPAEQRNIPVRKPFRAESGCERDGEGLCAS